MAFVLVATLLVFRGLYVLAPFLLTLALGAQGRDGEAISQYRWAAAIDPDPQYAPYRHGIVAP